MGRWDEDQGKAWRGSWEGGAGVRTFDLLRSRLCLLAVTDILARSDVRLSHLGGRQIDDLSTPSTDRPRNNRHHSPAKKNIVLSSPVHFTCI